MDGLNIIIKKIEVSIGSDFEVVLDEYMEEIENNYNQLETVKPLLELMERHPLIDFGSPGGIVHFVEKFYKKGYEEELLDSLKRMPSLHTIWMLNRLINGTDNPENYLSLMKEISQSETYSKEIRDQALYFLSDN